MTALFEMEDDYYDPYEWHRLETRINTWLVNIIQTESEDKAPPLLPGEEYLPGRNPTHRNVTVHESHTPGTFLQTRVEHNEDCTFHSRDQIDLLRPPLPPTYVKWASTVNLVEPWPQLSPDFAADYTAQPLAMQAAIPDERPSHARPPPSIGTESMIEMDPSFAMVDRPISPMKRNVHSVTHRSSEHTLALPDEVYSSIRRYPLKELPIPPYARSDSHPPSGSRSSRSASVRGADQSSQMGSSSSPQPMQPLLLGEAYLRDADGNLRQPSEIEGLREAQGLVEAVRDVIAWTTWGRKWDSAFSRRARDPLTKQIDLLTLDYDKVRRQHHSKEHREPFAIDHFHRIARGQIGSCAYMGVVRAAYHKWATFDQPIRLKMSLTKLEAVVRKTRLLHDAELVAAIDLMRALRHMKERLTTQFLNSFDGHGRPSH